MKAFLVKDKKNRELFSKYENKRKVLKSISHNIELESSVRWLAQIELDKLPKNSSLTRIRNRCVITGRGRGINSRFKVSRIKFRELSLLGMFPGVKKAV